MVKTCVVILGANYTREKITALFDKTPEVSDWFYGLPYSIFVTSSFTPRQLSELIEKNFGNDRLFVAEVPSNMWGRMDPQHWTRFK